MDSISKQELISTISKQADQIKRYETRLRDVVTAYKGLSKEKEALQTSVKALNKSDALGDSTADGSSEDVGAIQSAVYIDESLFMEDFPEEKFRVDQVEEIEEVKISEQQEVSAHKKIGNKTAKTGEEWFDRSEINVDIERIDDINEEPQTSNKLEEERLRVKQAKRTLITQQIQQNSELHNIKLENEKLKKEIFQTLLQKVKEDSVAALTLSIATLTAEKNRMEEAFLADKKVTRDKYENLLQTMREETKSLIQQHLAETNNLKAKISYEIQEREKERTDHAAMLKELHAKLNSERVTKEKLEDRMVIATESNSSQAELEKKVRDLSSSLEASQRRLQRAEARTLETPALLVRLQQKLALGEQAHSIAIREEQIKAKRAEEAARKICARQEERVALLEGKIAELSQTVGEYDLMRRRDQQIIQQLKEKLNGQILDQISSRNEESQSQQKSETDNEKIADSEYLQTLIDKIHILKKEFISENEKLGNPIDITTIFSIEGYENIHSKCKEAYEELRLEFEYYKKQNAKKKAEDGSVSAQNEIEDLKSEITVLREKVDTYKMLLEEETQDKADSLKIWEEKLKNEQDYHKEIQADLKMRIQSLEKQVQTQRDRYAALLEETDNLIRARNDRSRKVSVDDAWKEGHRFEDASAPPHMLHYAHELARKDLDISQLRKDKHVLEGQFRDCQREATIEKERFKEVIRTLKDEIDRLRRIQSREGANLEYLKNVVMAYLMSTDYAGRKHMMNAIATVLHFTDQERRDVFGNL